MEYASSSGCETALEEAYWQGMVRMLPRLSLKNGAPQASLWYLLLRSDGRHPEQRAFTHG